MRLKTYHIRAWRYEVLERRQRTRISINHFTLRMLAPGQSRHSDDVRVMSGLPLKTDIDRRLTARALAIKRVKSCYGHSNSASGTRSQSRLCTFT